MAQLFYVVIALENHDGALAVRGVNLQSRTQALRTQAQIFHSVSELVIRILAIKTFSVIYYPEI